MRILFLTNFFPPASFGGYEQWCLEVMEELKKRDHEIFILTSRYRRNDITLSESENIYRDLYLEMDFISFRNALTFFTHRPARERANLWQLKQKINDVKPDILVIWGMWNLNKSLAAYGEKLMPERTAYYIADYWPFLPDQYENYWRAPAQNWALKFPKSILSNYALRKMGRDKAPVVEFAHVMIPSVFMRDDLLRKNLSVKQTNVVYGAIDTKLYNSQSKRHHTPQKDKISLLYVGRLTHDKGVHTAIHALNELVNNRGYTCLDMKIIGKGDIDYEAKLRDQVNEASLGQYVSFVGNQTKEDMPDHYQQADIFLFTSIWEEPFGRVIVEAMASSVAVVGTATGGAKEILLNEKNGLTYPPEDVAALTDQLIRLIESPTLRRCLAEAGYKTAVNKFDIGRMTNEIESNIISMVN